MNYEMREVIIELIHEGRFAELRAYEWDEWLIPDLANLLNDLGKSDRVILFRILPRLIAAEVFAYLEKEERNTLLKDLNDEETRFILANLSPDDRTALFEELPGQATQRMLNLLSPSDLKEARFLLGYPEESVGRLMSPDYVAVRPHWTVHRALAHVRAKAHSSETIHTIYVTDDKWKLLDALDLTHFILADPDTQVDALMDDYFVSLSAFDDRELAVHQMQKYDVFSLPVVDSDGILLGLVTFDDVMDVAEQEATEDFHRSAAMVPLKAGYSTLSIKELVGKRIGWLVILIILSIISIGVIASFEKILASMLVLGFFMTMLCGTGGNAGSQASTLMVRALATGDVTVKDWLQIFLKEMLVGILLGGILGIFGALFGWWQGGAEEGLVVAMIVGLSILVIVFVSNLIGTTLPFLLTKLNIDPAVASNPLITSITDMLALFIYFTIATAMLSIVA